MKKDIHPAYHYDAKMVCTTCGTIQITGSTEKEVRVEICSNCHPFYTGKQNLVDTAGRVDRFKRLVERRDTARAKRSTAKSAPTSSKKHEA